MMQSGFDRQQFGTEVEGIATTALSGNDSDSATSAAHLVLEVAELKCRELIGDDLNLDCRAGCSHCCIVNVSVLQPEAASIAAHLANHRSDFELDDMHQKLSALERETRWLDDEERIMTKKNCAFLNDAGSCSIYPVRPLLCRAVTSTDASACKESLAMVSLGENVPVMANLIQRDIFETAFTSLGQALGNNNLDERSYRLTGSVRAHLEKHLH